MKFWQKHKWKIIVPVLIVLALAAAFTFGDRDMPKQKDTSEQPTVAAPVETPEQDTAAADVPDDVETGPVLSLIHISEPTRQAEISYAVFCLKKKKKTKKQKTTNSEKE